MSYLLNVFKTGAVNKTPLRIIKSIIREVEINIVTTIVEFGSGKGEITEKLLQKRKPDDKLKYFGFEINEKMCADLTKRFPDAHFFCTNALCFNDKISAEYRIDYFICSIPLSFYKKEELKKMFENMKKMLLPNGKIIFLFHAGWLIPLFKKKFPGISIKKYFHLPLYYLAIYN